MADAAASKDSTVEFFGDTFALNDDVSQFALLEFAAAASDGQDGDTMEGLASMMRLVKECVAEKDLPRFLGVARKNRATAADLLPVLSATFEVQAERPTGRPVDSSAGPAATVTKSESSSGDKVSDLFPGRPDMAVAVKRSRQTA